MSHHVASCRIIYIPPFITQKSPQTPISHARTSHSSDEAIAFSATRRKWRAFVKRTEIDDFATDSRAKSPALFSFIPPFGRTLGSEVAHIREAMT